MPAQAKVTPGVVLEDLPPGTLCQDPGYDNDPWLFMVFFATRNSYGMKLVCAISVSDGSLNVWEPFLKMLRHT